MTAHWTVALVADIKQTIRRRASPRHVPAEVLQVDDIPRTRSGKVAELAVKRVLAGAPVPNTMALENPDVLDAYKRLRGELLGQIVMLRSRPGEALARLELAPASHKRIELIQQSP